MFVGPLPEGYIHVVGHPQISAIDICVIEGWTLGIQAWDRGVEIDNLMIPGYESAVGALTEFCTQKE